MIIIRTSDGMSLKPDVVYALVYEPMIEYSS